MHRVPQRASRIIGHLPLTIKEIAKGLPGSPVTAYGWITAIRKQKHISFIQINDGSTNSHLQVILQSPHATDLKLAKGASVQVKGVLEQSPGPQQPIELLADAITILGECPNKTYPIQKADHSLDFLRANAHLRLRTSRFAAIARIRNHALSAFRSYLQNAGFFEITAPVTTFVDCEGAGETFSIEGGKEMFGKPAYLTVSAQLHAEIAASSLGRVFTFGPVLRAEKHNTFRHLSEFWMLEAELSFINQTSTLIELVQDMLSTTFQTIYANAAAEFKGLNLDGKLEERWKMLQEPFEQISYTTAIELLQKTPTVFKQPVKWGASLQLEHERHLCQAIIGRPVFIYDYPAKDRPFYMRRNGSHLNLSDTETVANFDLLLPYVYETVGGSLREERYELLLDAFERHSLSRSEYDWYLDLRRYGSVPHGGFGVGFDRFLQFITGTVNIKDVVLAPRTPDTAAY